jgi:hypothetical protein
VIWTLGTAVGTDSLTASLANGASVTITATATAGPLAALALVDGDGQNVAIGVASSAMIVRAVDANGNPVSGVTVGFSTDNVGGLLTPTSMVTGADGLASVTLTPVAPTGPFTVTATAGAVPAFVFSGTITP